MWQAQRNIQLIEHIFYYLGLFVKRICAANLILLRTRFHGGDHVRLEKTGNVSDGIEVLGCASLVCIVNKREK